jgi:hypothetical protein
VDSWADNNERRYHKIQFDCVARNVTELDRDDGESLARSDEEMQSQDAGFNLPLWRKVLESLPALYSRVHESRNYRTDANEESRAIRTAESRETISTTSSTNVSPT